MRPAVAQRLFIVLTITAAGCGDDSNQRIVTVTSGERVLRVERVGREVSRVVERRVGASVEQERDRFIYRYAGGKLRSVEDRVNGVFHIYEYTGDLISSYTQEFIDNFGNKTVNATTYEYEDERFSRSIFDNGFSVRATYEDGVLKSTTIEREGDAVNPSLNYNWDGSRLISVGSSEQPSGSFTYDNDRLARAEFQGSVYTFTYSNGLVSSVLQIFTDGSTETTEYQYESGDTVGIHEAPHVPIWFSLFGMDGRALPSPAMNAVMLQYGPAPLPL